MRRVVLSGLAVFACAAFGQTAENLTFEVASVRPATPLPQPALGRSEFLFRVMRRGGPGTSDPGQITWSNSNLKGLLALAYDVKAYQISGPAWFDTERYDIVAKVPAGATMEEVNMMLRNLLADRFGVVVHHDSKEFQVEELTVAKGGPKFKETTLDPNFAGALDPNGRLPAGPPKLDKNGFPDLPGPSAIITPTGPTSAHWAAKAQPMSGVAAFLGNQLNQTVIDNTGLTGRYDIQLEFTPELRDLNGTPLPPPPRAVGPGLAASADNTSEPGTNLAAAIHQQLGLRLVSGKAKLDVIVVDKAEKVPTEN